MLLPPEEAVNEVKRQAMSELQKAVSDAERKAHELITTERAKMERALAEAKRQASEDALTVINQQEDSSEVEVGQGSSVHHGVGRGWESVARWCPKAFASPWKSVPLHKTALPSALPHAGAPSSRACARTRHFPSLEGFKSPCRVRPNFRDWSRLSTSQQPLHEENTFSRSF